MKNKNDWRNNFLERKHEVRTNSHAGFTIDMLCRACVDESNTSFMPCTGMASCGLREGLGLQKRNCPCQKGTICGRAALRNGRDSVWNLLVDLPDTTFSDLS